MHIKFRLESLKERDHSEGLDIDGKAVLSVPYGNRGESVDWIHFAEDRDRWRALVNTVMKFS
jgi:hypothetical protein